MHIVDAAKEALKKPSDFGWWGRDEMFITWGWSGISKHRDSHLIDVSNFHFVSDDLIKKYEDDFQIVGMSHWAVGHVDHLIVRILEDENAPITEDNITDAFKEAFEWVTYLKEDYCIASDDHYSTLVSEKVFEYAKCNLPSQIHTGDSIEDTVGDILDYLQTDESYDYDETVPSDEDMLFAAYFMRLCDYSEREFWDEFVEENNLRPIIWNEITQRPSGVHIEIPGQTNIFD